MIFGLLLATAVAFICYALYKSSANCAEYFKNRNVKYYGLFPIIKALLKVLIRSDGFVDINKRYKTLPNETIFGMYDFGVRSYFLRDPEAFKRITIKDFGHFQDHRVVFSMDEMLRNILTQMEGEKWHQMRATLSPTFTGSKMRLMFDLITECADRIVVHLSEKVASGERINVEMKDFFTRYTNDVIATCAFGIEVNSFADPDNEFFASAKRVTKPSLLLTLSKFIFAKCLPRVARALDIKVLDTDPFKKIILETMEIRQKNKISRPDMINTLMQLQQEQQTNEESEVEKKSNENADVVRHKWDDNELLAQCFIFFSAGLEPPSIILTFAAYELVCNPDIQQKLYEEIAEVDKDLDGKRISYDAIQKMKYLDQVINETLRKWPSVVATDRVCVKDYDYNDGRLNFKMEKGSVVSFSIFEMHHNPTHYPNPDKFDPERFSDENKHNIIPGTLAPFGLGPRNCIGSRFALMEIKVILYHLLLNFTFEANGKTQIPIKLKKIELAAKQGVHLELKPREAIQKR